MTLTYATDSNLRKLTPVLDEHNEWFVTLARYAFYPELRGKGPGFRRPDSFGGWLEIAVQDPSIDPIVLENLKRAHDEMHLVSEELMKSLADNDRPPLKLFDKFSNLFDGFVTQLRRLEQDMAQSDIGFDPVTGLRNRKAMIGDLERELERRSRRGKPFALALARIDNFAAIKQMVSEEDQRVVLQSLGRLIRLCIRSFDDAYRSGDAEFVMSLKHTGTAGATAAVNRLRGFITEEKLGIMDADGALRPVTMSYCVAEPLPGDTLPQLMDNMREDLDRYQDAGGNTALEYYEQSPLARFVQTKMGNS